MLHGLSVTPAPWVEIATVTAANLAATAVKFLLFRHVVFVPRGGQESNTPVTSASETETAK